jgi:hypothetical protein
MKWWTFQSKAMVLVGIAMLVCAYLVPESFRTYLFVFVGAFALGCATVMTGVDHMLHSR